MLKTFLTLGSFFVLIYLSDVQAGEKRKLIFDGKARRDTNTNSYIDKVIENARSLIVEHNFDPYILNPLDVTFPIKIVFKLQGRLEMKKPLLHGLAAIRRYGNTTTNVNMDAIEISAGIGVDNLVLDGRTNISVGIFNFTFDLAMAADFVAARINVRIPLTEKGAKPHVTRFQIEDIGTIKANNRNWGIFNFVAEAILEKVLNEMKDIIREELAKPITETLNEIFQKIPM